MIHFITGFLLTMGEGMNQPKAHILKEQVERIYPYFGSAGGGEPKHISEILPQVLADFERVKRDKQKPDRVKSQK